MPSMSPKRLEASRSSASTPAGCTLSFIIEQRAQKKPPHMERLQVGWWRAYRPSLERMSTGMASLCTMMPTVFMLK